MFCNLFSIKVEVISTTHGTQSLEVGVIKWLDFGGVGTVGRRQITTSASLCARTITFMILVAKSVGSQVWACCTVYMPEKPRNIMVVSGTTFALLGFFDFATSIRSTSGRLF